MVKFDITDFRCSFSSMNDLITKINDLIKLEYDVIALVERRR